MPSVYLLHYDRRMGRKRHYIGFCHDSHPAKRIAQHRAGRGSADTKRALKMGIVIEVAAIWSGPTANEKFERFLKDGMDTSSWCPLCRKGLKPVPKLTDYTAEEAAHRRALVLEKHGAEKLEAEKALDRKIREEFGSGFECL